MQDELSQEVRRNGAAQVRRQGRARRRPCCAFAARKSRPLVRTHARPPSYSFFVFLMLLLYFACAAAACCAVTEPPRPSFFVVVRASSQFHFLPQPSVVGAGGQVQSMADDALHKKVQAAVEAHEHESLKKFLVRALFFLVLFS